MKPKTNECNNSIQSTKKNTEKCCISKAPPEKPYVINQRAMRKIEDNQKKFAEEMRDIAQATLRDEFDSKAISKTMYNEIGRLVYCAKAAQNDDLNEKRVRLQKFLTAEDEEFEHEFHEFMNQRLEEDVQKRKNTLLLLKSERDEKQRQFVEQKNMQKLISNCESLRPIMQHQLLVESKNSQLLQIRERQTLQAMERDQAQLWENVARRGREQFDQREQQKLATQRMNAICVQKSQKQQIADRAERRHLERHGLPATCCRAGEQMPDPVDEARDRREKCVRHAAELIEQAAENRRARSEQAEQVRQLEATIMATCRSEIAAEKERMLHSRTVQRKETAQYLDYLLELRCHNKMGARQLDQFIDDLNEKLSAQRSAQRCKGMAERRDRERAMHAERGLQIEERRRNRCNECNERFCEAIVERELAQRNAGADREAAYARLLRNMQHAKDLLQQAEETARHRADQEAAQNNQVDKSMEENEAACNRVAEMLVRGETRVTQMHPNTRLLHKESRP